jgi:anti-anti-sigma regulatory factor
MKQRIRPAATLGLEIAGSVVLSALVLWTWFAFPWFERVECLRTTEDESLRGLWVLWNGSFSAAYTWIPVVLVAVYLGLAVRPGGRLLTLFGLFIVLCGATHAASVLLLYWPYYWLAVKLYAAGGAVSVATAYVLHKRRPDLLALGRQGVELREQTARAERLAEDARVSAESAEREAESSRVANERLLALVAELQETNERLAARETELVEANERLETLVDKTRAQERAIAELSTPAIEIDEGVLLLPIVGVFDSARSLQIVEQASATVTARGVEVVIVDVTGVPVMDSGVVDAFVKLARVLALLGARCVLTGIRGAVAQTMVEQDVAIEGFVTRATLKAGIREARAMAAAARR